MELAAVQVHWCMPIPYSGADASPIPVRGGVYEILYEESEGVERLYVGYTQDLRRAFVSHMGGSKGGPELRKSMTEQVTYFRYWECEDRARCLDVVAALADLHYYDCGYEQVEDSQCVRLIETY